MAKPDDVILEHSLIQFNMKINITSSVFKLEKCYLYQNGVEYHKQCNRIGDATPPLKKVAPFFCFTRRPYNRVGTRWCHQILVWSVEQTRLDIVGRKRLLFQAQMGRVSSLTIFRVAT